MPERGTDEGEPRLHRTLARQLRRHGLDPQVVPDQAGWQSVLAAVTLAYDEADADRYTMERSIEVSSREMRGLHDVLRRQAMQDELTGLPNRAALMQRLTVLLAGHRNGGPAPAVLFIDLDGFKLVNDSLGHEAGDDLLVRAAARIARLLGDDDLVARLGGDEFVVVLSRRAGPAQAQRVAARVNRELERPFRILGRDAVVSASVGVALASPEEISPDELLRRADLAMYAAKTAGRSRSMLFTDAMQAAADQQLSIKSALRAAIGEGELLLEFQPIVRLPDLSVTGHEALVRWRRPGVGLLMPDDFIPVAEEAHLIGMLDAWVLDAACSAAAQPGFGQIAVNISSRSLDSAQIAETIGVALDRAGVDPQRLTLELTETALMAETAQVRSNLQRLRERGIQLAIDDFGTGYSSLARLRTVAVDQLKLDRSLITEIDERADVAAIVAAAITMGHALGHEVVAEGVERRAQLDLLRAMGCDAGQGHLFSAPGPLPSGQLSADALAARGVERHQERAGA